MITGLKKRSGPSKGCRAIGKKNLMQAKKCIVIRRKCELK
jgi:hypothetical protein